jgi:hypothetical protein
MPKYQVIVRGKDNEPETYRVKADDFRTVGAAENAAYQFFLLGNKEKPIAWFQISQVVAVIDEDLQEGK